MHFEQPAPGFHALRLRLGRLRLSRLMLMPCMLDADAYYVLRRCLALYGADACSDSCRCLACRALTCPTSIHMRV